MLADLRKDRHKLILSKALFVERPPTILTFREKCEELEAMYSKFVRGVEGCTEAVKEEAFEEFVARGEEIRKKGEWIWMQ